MEKQTKSYWQKLLFLGITVVIAASAVFVVIKNVSAQAGQDGVEIGATYDCGAGRAKLKVVSCDGTDDFDYCKIQTLNPNAPGGIGSEDNWYRKMIKNAIAEGCKIKDRPKQNGNRNETKPDQKAPTANTDSIGKDWKFKPGDRVMASPNMLNEDKYFQPCTVVKGLKPNSYHLLCDPHNGISFIEQTVREDFVRLMKDANPAPEIECSFEQPPGTVSRTVPASEALFKRIIYEQEAASYSRAKVGVVFETFQMGSSYKNTISGRKLLHDGLPQGTTVYPLKTKYVTCVEGTLGFNKRTVIETCFACAKDKFGEWTCGAACGAKKFLEQHNVPVHAYFFKDQ